MDRRTRSGLLTPHQQPSLSGAYVELSSNLEVPPGRGTASAFSSSPTWHTNIFSTHPEYAELVCGLTLR